MPKYSQWLYLGARIDDFDFLLYTFLQLISASYNNFKRNFVLIYSIYYIVVLT